MIPHAWEALVLVMAAYRWTRLGGWDDWPPIYKIRAWAIGERWVTTIEVPPIGFDVTSSRVQEGGPADGAAVIEAVEWIDVPELPGKTPDSEVDAVRPAYDRPLLAHLVHCPFCLGWWVSLATYAAWLIEPRWTLYAAAPFALSGAVGLIAKNLDP